MIEFSPGVAYVLPAAPECPAHGRMNLDKAAPLDPASVRYVCHGFDGEGCATVTEQPMTELGAIDRFVINF